MQIETYILDEYDLGDKYTSSTEKTLNVMGYIPIVSTVSGVGRVFYGVVQLIAGVAVGTFHLLGDVFRHNPNGYGYRSFRSYVYIPHGFANIIRGKIELVPLIGNLVTLFYDALGLRFSYMGEKAVDLKLRYI